MNLYEIYRIIGCSKQNVSYWEMHSYSTQVRKSITKVVCGASKLFELSDVQTEQLANTAGLTLKSGGRCLADFIAEKYKGKKKTLCNDSLISERMFRYYKKTTPTKQALIAIAVSLNSDVKDINILLRGYGYCLSESMAADAVVVWFINSKGRKKGAELLYEINEVLDEMSLPLLMTRQQE